jgi:hypothetical protein
MIDIDEGVRGRPTGTSPLENAMERSKVSSYDSSSHVTVRRLTIAVAAAGLLLLALVLANAVRASDPGYVQSGGKLTAAGAGGESRFGFSVSLSADGRTALIGERRGDTGEVGWIFARSDSTWQQQSQPLLPGEGGESCSGGECGFGHSLAISGDGRTAVIGAPAEAGGHGAAWVFTRSASGWSAPIKLEGEEEQGAARFGRSVALSADGSTALIGGSAGRGAAWVFTRTGTTWAQQGPRLLGDGEAGEGYFGRSVALSADGSLALIGAPGDSEAAGAAWVYARSGSTWAQRGSPLRGDEASGPARFGYSVALSDDGHSALIGGRSDAGGAGAAWALSESGAGWTQSKLTAGGGEGEFGYSVALSGDGAVAVVGAPHEEGHVGAASAFRRSGSSWLRQPQLSGLGESGPGWFGASVALSSSGATALVGGFRDEVGAGAAWAFQDDALEQQPPGEEAKQTTTEETSTTPGPTGSQQPQGGVLSSFTFVAPAPQLGLSGNLLPLSGKVFVKLPGASGFVLLSGLRQVPFGTIVDASHGKVTVTSAKPGGGTESLTLYGGELELTQAHNGLVTAALVGGDFSVCPKTQRHKRLAHASRSSRKHVVRKLWAEGHGSYSTKGNYATGAVLGTRWLTEDMCGGTLIRVFTDKVRVRNLVTHRSRIVKAGHSIFVKAP